MTTGTQSNSLITCADPNKWPGIEWLSITELKGNPRNPRTHSRKQIKKIRASMRKFGPLNPLVVDENNMILAGHGRAEAARQEGIERLPVLRYSHLSEIQKRAYLIADNKIAEEAGWDREMLAIELGELIELLPAKGLDIALTGFEEGEIDVLFADLTETVEPREALPDVPPHPTTRQGDLWQLDKSRLLCGDAREPAGFVRLMDGARASAVFCDPPYNVRVSDIGGRGQVRHPEFAFASGEMSPPQYRQFLAETLGNAVSASTENAVHYVCMDWRHIGDLIDVGRGVYYSMLNLVVWNKSNAGQGSFYRSQHELIGVFQVGESPTEIISSWAASDAIAPMCGPMRASTVSVAGAWRRSPPIQP